MIPFILRRLALLPAILFGVTRLVYALFTQQTPGQRARCASDVTRNSKRRSPFSSEDRSGEARGRGRRRITRLEGGEWGPAVAP